LPSCGTHFGRGRVSCQSQLRRRRRPGVLEACARDCQGLIPSRPHPGPAVPEMGAGPHETPSIPRNSVVAARSCARAASKCLTTWDLRRLAPRGDRPYNMGVLLRKLSRNCGQQWRIWRTALTLALDCRLRRRMESILMTASSHYGLVLLWLAVLKEPLSAGSACHIWRQKCSSREDRLKLPSVALY
jgi:hypothetical protein